MESMGDHVAVLESRFARLAAMRSELDDSMNVIVLITTLKDNNEYEPLITSISTMKEEEATWRQVSMLFTEEAKHLKRKTESNSLRRENGTAKLAQASHKFNGNISARKYKMHHDIRCYYCDKRRHLAKDCNARKRDGANKAHYKENREQKGMNLMINCERYRILKRAQWGTAISLRAP